jgi:PAS domain S-box-containing protein
MIGDENARLLEVEKFLQLNLNHKKEFKDITELASALCEKPISLITLLDQDTNWIKVASGIDIQSSPREISFCQYCIQSEKLLIIPDATKDRRLDNNPLVYSASEVRFYAGAPLILSSGHRAGTLCLFDTKPGKLTKIQQRTLTILSRQVVILMELELGKKQLLEHIRLVEEKNESLRAIAQLQSHEIRQPLTSLIGLVNLVTTGTMEIDKGWITMLKDTAHILDSKIHSIVNETMGNKDLKLLRFNKMIEEIEDYAILLLDREGNIENWNKGARKIKGYHARDIVGKNFSTFYRKEDIESGLPKRLLDSAVRNKSAKDEGWRMRKDGTCFWAKVIIQAIHNNTGEVIGFTKVTRDLGLKAEV